MSVTEFFSMGGYGFYVWASMGVTLFLIIAEVVVLRRNHRTIVQRLSRMMRMNTEENR